MGFYDALNFTSANEDGRTELAALAPLGGARVLCLTASGARPLDLLLGDPAGIVALDLNPAQNHLLALKIAPHRRLGMSDLYAYLGITPCADRMALHAGLEPDLPDDARAFWRARRGLIARGVWYAGRWEKVLRLGARGNRLIRGRRIDELFAAENIAEQAAIWHRHFDDWKWRGAIRLLSRRWVWTHIIGEPGGAHLPPPQETEARLAGAFNRAVGSFLFRESDFASLIFRGRHMVGEALPLHLMPDNLETVRARLDGIHSVTGGLSDLNPVENGHFDAFSLSDFGSYCDQAAYDSCWRAIASVARPDARLCERSFMNPLSPSDASGVNLVIDSAASDTLSALDRAFIYRIRTATIA